MAEVRTKFLSPQGLKNLAVVVLQFGPVITILTVQRACRYLRRVW